MALKASDEATIRQWEKENREGLQAAYDFLIQRFINLPIGNLPFDSEGEYRKAALAAAQAIRWLMEPMDIQVIETRKTPFIPNPQ